MARRPDGCDALSSLDREAAAEHLAGCEGCRVEQALLAELAEPEGSGALDPLEGLARQRYVQDLLARADGPAAARPEASARPLWNPLSLLLGAGLGAAATAAALLIAWHVAGPEARPGEAAGAQPGAQAAVEHAAARLLLSTGQLLGPEGAIELGAEVPAGPELRVEGQAALELAPGQLVVFEPGSTFALGDRAAAPAAPSVELRRGELVASVTPRRDGARALAIATARGVVTVTGTIVGVAQRGDDFEVRVLRGTVETAAGAARGGVGEGEAVVLGEGSRRGLEEAEASVLWDRAARLSELSTEAGAMVELRTTPSPAEVLVDGVPIGSTPLRAALRPGHRRIELRIGERVAARAVLDLGPGETVARSFVLAPAPESPPAPPEASDGGAAPRAPDAGPGPAASVEELLERAQTQRAQREFAGAAAAYRELLRQHPEAAASRAALVSLAQLELEQLGRPAEALRLYERSLGAGSTGPLAQEAAWGRARALRALGRTDEERQALEQLLGRFPGALQAGAARRRLEELDSPAQQP